MYYIQKVVTISASHCLDLPYDSPCNNIHGHNYRITVTCKTPALDDNGMVVDFSFIKKQVMAWDHRSLNDCMDGRPTAERMAEVLCHRIPNCVKVDVEETDGSVATYVPDC